MTVRRDIATPESVRRRAGFTLLEILVVISLMGVVTTLGISAFFDMSKAWQSTRTMSELDREASNAFRMIKRDFTSVVSTELSGISVRGVHRNLESVDKSGLYRYFDRVLADDAVVIPVPAGAGGAADIDLISYSVNRADNGHRLVRTFGDVTLPEENALPEMDVVNPSIAEVIRFRIEYSSGGGEWSAEWTDSLLPQAVRISMTLEEFGQYGQHLQITRKAVFAIHVR